MTEIRAACSPGEVRIAVTDHDTLLDVALWRPGCPDGLEDWHVVRVQKAAPALGGAFVLLEDGQSGFLSTRDALIEGTLIAARVSRSAQNGKGLRLRRADMPAEAPSAPKLLERGPTPLDELADRYRDAPIFVDDAGIAAKLPVRLRPRLQRCQQAFDGALESDFDSLCSSDADLGLLTASFFPTPALVAIDLDSTAAPDFKGNVAAFPALARQIRLRNLSGTILVDPAGVKTRKRPALVSFLREALSDDPLKPDVLGATPSGLLELTRSRRRPPLHELLSSPQGLALSILRTILREDRPGQTLTASIRLIKALESDPEALADFTSRRARTLDLVLDPNASPASWSLS
ncbi:ribonuclease E/G [Gluconobacter sp. Dm-73]|uniref:ribonuclease E/G n=1 Tax=Gluconobacter sp. Dm-73 TaxID=2799802 RepID=UPI001B8D6352|nr:ribonuclease E/G [Gluconobacter sp. Dm-73]MBS1075323.1 ribonuclease E/G [Gluconobacter sp. Dm-73]